MSLKPAHHLVSLPCWCKGKPECSLGHMLRFHELIAVPPSSLGQRKEVQGDQPRKPPCANRPEHIQWFFLISGQTCLLLWIPRKYGLASLLFQLHPRWIWWCAPKRTPKNAVLMISMLWDACPLSWGLKNYGMVHILLFIVSFTYETGKCHKSVCNDWSSQTYICRSEKQPQLTFVTSSSLFACPLWRLLGQFSSSWAQWKPIYSRAFWLPSAVYTIVKVRK